METKVTNTNILRMARTLVNDPQFLFKAGRAIGRIGVIGEERNRLILFLAGVSRGLPEPGSVLLKGSSSSGKSRQVKDVVRLFPPDCVVERAGLSGKALAYGNGSLARKIMVINEYRCGKDAQQLLRLLQSEGEIKHEATQVRGVRRNTRTVERTGTPVVLTTTTDHEVFTDDETRFLSIWADESPAQTLAILTAQATVRPQLCERDLQIWRTALALVDCRPGDFQRPPAWLRYVAQQLPLNKVRVRRDWSRFLTFLKAVALCRAGTDRKEPLDVEFPDYCVAYRILEPVFASTLRGLPTQELLLSDAVARLTKQLGRSVTVNEVAKHLRWKRSLVYKYLRRAVQHRLIVCQAGTREKNAKRLLPGGRAGRGFLPTPRRVFKQRPEIGSKVAYIDPFTGRKKVFHHTQERSHGAQE